jgi:hypothetical protein
MIKRLVFGVAAGALALAPLSARADWYINPELNASAGLDSGTGGATLETHIGYDFENGGYLQAGPAAVLPDSGENEVEFTGKAGISGGPLYGEISFSTGDEFSLGFKTGAKFSF